MADFSVSPCTSDVLRRGVALLLTVLASSAHACECLWQGPFVESQQTADLVVSGKVLTHSGNSLDLAVERVLRGTEYRPDIRIWGDNGKLCRPSIYKFPANSEWVFALNRIREIPEGGFDPNTPNLSFGRIDDYAISSCGVNWLLLKHDFLHGNVAGAQRWQYEDPDRLPVLLDLLAGWLDGAIPLKTLQFANRSDDAARKLLNETRLKLRHDEDRQPLAELLAEEGVELPADPDDEPHSDDED